MSKDFSAEKRSIRAEIRAARQEISPDERRRLGAALTGHLIELSFTLGIDSVAAYLSTANEPATRQFLEWATGHSIRVILPISREDGMLDWTPFDGSIVDGVGDATDHLGMPIAAGEILDRNEVGKVGLIIVPAASVDQTGMRLGWGRGYFDRMLGAMPSRPPVYAVIFDSESVETLPSEPHDQRVDGIVTPSGVTTFQK
jgi:5-formyltetrahydrofolate cyclo-ligase